ncbi:MAG: alpha/beta fold hydrolase [Variibacter sp.]
MTKPRSPRTIDLKGGDGHRLVADVFESGGPPVLFLHGAGQTRHAWRRSAEQLSSAGWTTYAIDHRGHGDSDWHPDGAYEFRDFAGDVGAVADQIAVRHGGCRPAAIGASLGGLSSLFLLGMSEREPPPLSALVLVDITPRVDNEGVTKVRGFMRAHARDGFASVDEAAAAVAAYLPHRPRPRSNEGLQRNLRLGEDGRWRWHWDPRFLERRGIGDHDATLEGAMTRAARGLTIPVLLVRGSASELVNDEHVREFLDLVPHAQFVDVAGARHMVAGDKNDAFSDAILGFFADHVGSRGEGVASGHPRS